MKRIICCFLLISLFMFSFSFSSAENAPTRILFRGIPWCSNMSETIEIGEFNGYKICFEEPSEFKSWYTIDAINNCYHDSGIQTGYSVTVMSEIDVAGYNAFGPSFVFAYAYENNNVVKDIDKAQLVLGTYYFLVSDRNEAEVMVKDLKEKLSSLYGKPVSDGKPEKKGIESGSIGYKHTVWMDADGNKAILSHYSYEVYLSFVWNKADERLQEIYDSLKESTPEIDNSQNINGL